MAYLGKTPSQAVRSRYYFTATGGETSLSGTDDNSNTLTFTDGNYVDVYLNGVLLVAGTDYNTTTANTIGGLTALVASDVVEVVVYDTFSVFSGNVSSNFSVGGNLTVTGSATFDTNTLYVDSVNNRVGVGTTSPDGNIHIFGGSAGTVTASGSQAVIENNSTTKLTFLTPATNSAVIEFGDPNDQNVGSIKYDHSNNSMPFTVNASEAMRIDSSGNVGIGTSSPNNYSGYATLALNDSTGGIIEFLDDNVVKGEIFSGANDLTIGTSTASGTLRFRTASGSEAMRIDSSGNLLVGTTSTSIGTSSGGYLAASGFAAHTRDGGTVADFNRLTSDGTIINFRKDGTAVGSIGTNGGRFYIKDDTYGGITFGSGGNSVLPAGTTGAFADNTTDLGSSSARFKDLYLSGGVYLGGTGSSNLLDDYEEGTWTPVFVSGTGGYNGSAFNTIGAAKYVKIGKFVRLQAYFRVTGGSNLSVGNILVFDGQPFTPDTATQMNGVGGTQSSIETGGASSGIIQSSSNANMVLTVAETGASQDASTITTYISVTYITT